ncbi:MAG: rRNA pseudouridine synthase [Magnetococcales bacterium]|nr:rRNA pseudouridine synthase [Magnetococcales bacterium]
MEPVLAAADKPGRPAPAATGEKDEAREGIRLQKWMADAGLCSRREGERWILAGRVLVNGEVIRRMGTLVRPQDQVMVDGRMIQRDLSVGSVVLVYHKPRGVVCTRKDPEGRPTLYDRLSPDLPRLVSVGRLDFTSEGLLLLTNDGQLAHRLAHPSHEVERVYRVRAHGPVTPRVLDGMAQGVTLEDGPTGPLQVAWDSQQGSNSWLTITLREGRNRMVRRICAAFGLEVSRLIRVSYGGVELGDVPPGEWRMLQPRELMRLRKAAGMGSPGKKGG